MKNFKKWLLVLYLMVSAVLLVITPAIYLTGVWRIELVGSVALNFEQAGYIGLLASLTAIELRDRTPQWLSLSDTSVAISSRKARCWRARIITLAILLLISGGAYLLGKIYNLHEPFEYLGSLGLLDLVTTWIIYTFATLAAIGMPKAEEKRTDQSDSKDTTEKIDQADQADQVDQLDQSGRLEQSDNHS